MHQPSLLIADQPTRWSKSSAPEVLHPLADEAGDDDAACVLLRQFLATKNAEVAKVKRVAIAGSGLRPRDVDWQEKIGFQPDSMSSRPCTTDRIFAALERLRLPHQTAPGSSSPAALTSDLTSTDRQDVPGATMGAGA